MASTLAGLKAFAWGSVLMQLDLNGFFFGNEFVALIAGLLTALLTGLANALISGSFGPAV